METKVFVESREIMEGSLKINNMDMGYVCCGKGPDLVLLHRGFLPGMFQWESYLQSLSESFTVYAPDSRGHGKSTNPDNTWSFEQKHKEGQSSK